MTIAVAVRFVEPPNDRRALPLVWFDRPVRNAPAMLELPGSWPGLWLLPHDLEPLGALSRWLAVGSVPHGLDFSTLTNASASLTYADRPER